MPEINERNTGLSMQLTYTITLWGDGLRRPSPSGIQLSSSLRENMKAVLCNILVTATGDTHASPPSLCLSLPLSLSLSACLSVSLWVCVCVCVCVILKTREFLWQLHNIVVMSVQPSDKIYFLCECCSTGGSEGGRCTWVTPYFGRHLAPRL